MADQKWFDGYAGQSTAELVALEGEYRIDSLVLAFEQGIDQRAAAVGDDALTETEVAILAIEALEREVNNGGYSQFFVNDSARFTPVIVEALARIGCDKTAGVTGRAIAALGLGPAPRRDEIEAAIGSDNPNRDRQLEQCDGDYFSSGEDIAGRLFAHIKTRPHEISLP